MATPLRRSARIAAQQQTPVKPIIQTTPLTPTKPKKTRQSPKSTVVKKIEFKDDTIDYDPNFTYTVDWIRNVRYELSCFANDLEDETHLKVFLDLAKQVEWQWGNIREWSEDLKTWYRNRNKTGYGNNPLADEREHGRRLIEICYDALKTEEEKISKEKHDVDYYYPLDQPTKARMVRSNKMTAHINEFIKLCKGFGITIHKNEEDVINPHREDNWIQIGDEAKELLYEGCPIVPLCAYLQPNQITNVLTFSKRFAPSWDGKVNKWGYTDIPIVLP